eukprot:5819061-Prymnesium_polylepis.1
MCHVPCAMCHVPCAMCHDMTTAYRFSQVADPGVPGPQPGATARACWGPVAVVRKMTHPRTTARAAEAERAAQHHAPTGDLVPHCTVSVSAAPSSPRAPLPPR